MVYAVLAVIFTAGVLGASMISSPDAAASEVAGTWESGGYAPFSGLECPHPETQFALVTSPVREGDHAARFHISGSDVWSNGTVRCLAAKYDSGETTGMDAYFHISMYIPSPGISSNLIWELHHPSSLYNLAGCGVAPFAITTDGSRLLFRIATGDCNVGSGWSHWEPNIPIPGLSPYPKDTWIDIIVHIRFAESSTGLVELWSRTAGSAWPATPQLVRQNIPTMPYASSTGVRNVQLYTELGLYPGYSGYSGNDTIYIDDYRREASLAGAEAGDGTPVVTPVTTQTTPPAATTQTTQTTTTTASASPSDTAGSTTSQGTGNQGGGPSRVTPTATTPPATPSPPVPSAPMATFGLGVSSSLVATADNTTLRWSALVSGTAKRVEFFIDGRRRWTEYSAPWVYNGDFGVLAASRLGHGTHRLLVKAVAADGTSVTNTSFLTVGRSGGEAVFTSSVAPLRAENGTIKPPPATLARRLAVQS